MYDAEETLMGAIDEWLKESDIDGKTVNQVNLERFNKANIMALKIFDDPQEIRFEKPRQDLAYAQTMILYGSMDIEKSKNKTLYEEFIATVDDFSVSPINGRTVTIRFSVDDVWEE